MRAEVYWLTGVWPGRLGLASRPRGDDWLEDEIIDWQRQGAKGVVSLLTPDEEFDLALVQEAFEVAKLGMQFSSLPIPDRGTPPDMEQLQFIAGMVDSMLARGEDVIVHCRQGIGRTGLLAAYLLVHKGRNLDCAMERLSQVRGVTVPETVEQVAWLRAHEAATVLPNLVS